MSIRQAENQPLDEALPERPPFYNHLRRLLDAYNEAKEKELPTPKLDVWRFEHRVLQGYATKLSSLPYGTPESLISDLHIALQLFADDGVPLPDDFLEVTKSAFERIVKLGDFPEQEGGKIIEILDTYKQEKPNGAD